MKKHSALTTHNVSAPDHESRRAIAEDLDDTFVVEAAAGTGKTTELVNRILRVLSTGRATMGEIVAVTFTEKAAGELKLRLREALEDERAAARHQLERGGNPRPVIEEPDGPPRALIGARGSSEREGASEASGGGPPRALIDVLRRLDAALETLEEAHVNTIHGFCAELLRQRPVEASVDPLFTVLTEAQSDRLYDRAFHAWLQEALAEPSEGLRRGLRRASALPPQAFRQGLGAAEGDGSIGRLRSAGLKLLQWRYYPRPWDRPVFDRAAAIDRLIATLHRLADLTSTPASSRDALFADTEGLRRLSRQIDLEQSFGQRDLDGWEARLIDLLRDRGCSRPRKGSGFRFGKDSSGRDVTRTEILSALDLFQSELQQFRDAADADLAALLQGELAGATARYEALKAAAGALDFTDLLARTRDLIVRDRTVREHLQAAFGRLFVDEFQDTDPVQAEILLLLSADDPSEANWNHVRPSPGKLFIVGDPKQAIYRFRGADVGTYWRVTKLVQKSGGRVLQLSTSYRSVPDIQRFVNAAFGHEMVTDERTLQAGYVPLAPHRPAEPSQPGIVGLPIPRPYGRSPALRPSARSIESSLPDAVAAFIAWLTDGSGWTATEPGVGQNGGSRAGVHESGGRVPVQPRHIAILFRRFVSFGRDVAREYAQAIEARGIPHLLVGGKAFHGREEVETIRAALAAIEWPDDELSVFATLKGSLFALDDEHLLEFRHRFQIVHPFRIPRELGGNSGQELALTADAIGHLQPIADALRALQRLHRGRNYRPVAETIGRLLAETRAHVGLILRPAGEQALANVLHVAELARQYEAGGGISFRGFIEELRNAADAAEAAEAPILEEGSDGVRLMTVHRAKGLEFPVVILADLTCPLSRGVADRVLDLEQGLCAMRIGGWAPLELHRHEAEEAARDRAESVRLAYVAATRARDLLVVPALGDGPWDGGWFDPLNRALYPPLESRRTARRAPGCPPFKSKDCVLERPNDETAGPSTVCPGLHEHVGGYSVVWWDPRALALGIRPPFGVRRAELIVRDVGADVVAAGRSRYDRWHLARVEARDAGQVASLAVKTTGEWTEDDGGAVTGLPIRPDHVEIITLPGPAPGTAPGTRHPAQHVARSTQHPAPDDGPSGRPWGSSFGLLVHAVLAQAPFDAATAVLQDLALREARVLGSSEGETAAAASLAGRVLAHDLLRRAALAAARGACWRETPVTLTLSDGMLIEGIVDLAFEEAGSWTVVDYKTDREMEAAGEARYRRQAALYASAIARVTGRPTRAVLLRV